MTIAMPTAAARHWMRGVTCLAMVLAGMSELFAQAADAGQDRAASIRQKIEQIAMSSDSELDAETRAKITDFYKSALVSLQQLDDLTAKAEAMRQQLSDATATAQRLAEERLAVQRLPPEEIRATSVAELEVALASRNANVTLLKQELKDLESQREKRTARRDKIREIKEQADARKAELQQQIDAAPPAGEPAALTEARRTDTRLRLEAFDRSLPLLDLELAVATAEEQAELLRLKSELKQEELKREEAAVEQLTKRIRELRQREAQQQIDQTRRQSEQTHPLLAELAEQNREDAVEAAHYPAKIRAVKRDTESIAHELEQQESRFHDIRRKEKFVGLTQPIGALLREQRSQFPDLAELDKRLESRVETIEEARLAAWRYSDERASLPDAATYVHNVLRESAVDGPQDSEAATLSPEQRQQLEEMAADLLTTRRELLTRLTQVAEEYRDALLDLDVIDRRYLQESREYLHYINERILWTRSADPLSIGLVRDDVRSLAWLLSPTNWQAVLHACMADPVENPLAFWPTLLTVLALYYVRMSIRPRLRALGGLAGKRGFLRYGPTAQAAVMTLMAAATGPVTLMMISWRLTEADDPTGFVRAVALAIQACAAILFPTELLREACRHHGLAEAHFAWPPRAVQHVRRILTWMKPVGLPVAFFAVLVHQYQPLSGGTPLERLLFIGGMALAAVTLHRLHAQNGGLTRAFRAERPRSWYVRFHRLWYLLGVTVPIGFAALSALGYHYSATQVANRLLWTIWLIVFLILIRSLAVRWILLSRRRLLLDQAYQRRAAEGAQNDAESTTTPVIEEDEIDFDRSTGQARQLLDIVGVAVTVMFLGMIWAETLPAFGLLDRQLWTVERVVQPASAVDGDGSAATEDDTPTVAAAEERTLVSITTLDLAVALLMALFTILAAKNLPGLMEMSVLNRLPLDNAARYAATRLASYMIVIVGVLMVSNRVGLRWENVQWLAAALTVGLGFGLQEVFANFVSGLIILFERPVRVGDIVTIDGATGYVSRIRMRATTITDWDRKELIVPNKSFITGNVLNWTLSDGVNRIYLTIGLALNSDVRRATEILLRICEDHPALLKDPAPSVCFEELTDRQMTLALRCYMPSFDGRLDAIHDVHTQVVEEFQRAGIQISQPHRDLRIQAVDGAPLQLPASEPKHARDIDLAAH